jgi:CHASE3 domain sensor protein
LEEANVPEHDDRQKLSGSIGAALVVALLMGVTTVISVTRMNSSIGQIVHADARRQVLADAINVNVTQLISILRAQLVRASVKDQTYADKYYRDYQKQIDELNRNVAQLAPLVVTPAGEAYVEAMRTGSPQMAEFNERIYQKASKGDINGSIALFISDFAPYANRMRTQSERFASLQTESMAEGAQTVKTEETQTLWLTGGMFLGCAVLAGIVMLIVRRINEDLRVTAASLSVGAAPVPGEGSYIAGSLD